MIRQKTNYSGLERVFDDRTPDWIVPVGRVLRELEVDGESTGNLKWGFRVPFKGQVVHKATPVSVDGEMKWVKRSTRFAIPDFIILSQDGMVRYKRMVDAARCGEKTINPFKDLMCDTGFYVEVFGNYYHSGEYVCGLSKEEHESEVVRAYESAGKRVLILWEDDIGRDWAAVGLPKLMEFVDEARGVVDVPDDWNPKSKVQADEESVLAWGALFDPCVYREMEVSDKRRAVDRIFEMMRNIEFPVVGQEVAEVDLSRFMDWVLRDSGKPTRFGLDYCSHYIRSMADARVSGCRSKRELWNDDNLLRKSIEWQLEHESGVHHAGRFLNAVCSATRFRAVSNMHPAFVVQVIRKLAGDVRGKLIYDPCAGWGGRLLAAHGLGASYVSIDANRKLVAELGEMVRDLRSDSVVVYGDSSNKDCVLTLMNGKNADLVFTSPPFYDKEIYSADECQSLKSFASENEWVHGFLIPMINNALLVLRDDGMAVFNLWHDFDSSTLKTVFSEYSIRDVDIVCERGGRSNRERFIFFEKRIDKKIATMGKVCCRICGREFGRLGKHVQIEHGLAVEQYLSRYGGEIAGERVKSALKERALQSKGKRRNKRIAYLCPDGRVVRRKDAWFRAWGTDTPPKDSKVSARDVELDRWAGKQEGIDFVTCTVCGYRGKNITRHVGREHGLDGYVGPLKSESCQQALSDGAKQAWSKRRDDKV